MRDGERLQRLYAQRRELRETERRVRQDVGGSRLHRVREQQTAVGMQLLLMRRRQA